MRSMSREELDYRNRTGRAPGGGGGGTTVVNVNSLDMPSYSAFAPRVSEPVMVRRANARQGSLFIDSQRNALRLRAA
jgi:hypothetical protein